MSAEHKIPWKLITRRYEREKKKLVMVPVTHHPLQSAGGAIITKDSSNGKTSKTSSHSKKHVFVDPLSSVLEGSDPLSSLLETKSTNPLSTGAPTLNESGLTKGKKIPLEDVSPVDGDTFVSWETHCLELSKFTTKQQLTLASSFLSSTETAMISSRNLPEYRRVVKVQNNIPDRIKGQSQTGAERVKARLEQLDSLGEGGISGGGSLREMGGLTQEQFLQHLLSLKEEMMQAWREEQRVKALKISIQCVKALALSPPEAFYPCKFAVISDLLDTIGGLVYARLKQLLASSHSCVHISPKYEAEETARNWFYKVASIRELLPRIYLEAALLPCYAILPEEGKGALNRLILMCRGVGDPLVGAYIRTYIVHVGQKQREADVDYIFIAVEDLILSCRWGWNGNGIEEIELLEENFERGGIIAERVFYPAIKWLFQCLPKTHDSLKRFLILTEESKGMTQYVVLRSILKMYPPVLLAPHCLTLLRILDACFAHGENPHDLLVDIALIVTKVAPAEDQKLDMLNGAWLLIVRVKSIQFYLKTTTAWLRYTGINYTCSEMDKILGDVLKRLSKLTAASPQISQPLLELLTTALTSNARSEELYTFSSFRGLLSIFQRESGSGVGMGSCHVREMRRLLEAAIQHHRGNLTDPAVVQLLLSLFASLHDGINALTTQDERRQISQLVNAFIRQVNYGKDFELQLEFYVNARASFSNLDSVLELLIQHVVRLQVSTLQMVKGHHTGKTAAFERACTAYCFITIPSLSCSLMKLRLYLLCGSVAMVNNCMGQGDACMKSAIRIIVDMASEAEALSTTSHLAEGVPYAIAMTTAYLVATPDPPTDVFRPLYLFRGLVNSLKSLSDVLDCVSFCKVNLDVLKGVCAGAQETLPYHFKNVDGNDTLYGSDPALRTEAETMCSEILYTVLILIKETMVGSDGVQITLVVDLLSTVLTYADLTDSKLKNLALSLLALVKKSSLNAKLKNEMQTMFDNRLRGAV